MSVTNYTIIIEKQKRIGTNTECYSAIVPVLGIATEADTVEEVEKEIKFLIQFHLDSLTEEGEEIPVETASALVTRYQATLPEGAVVQLNS